MVEGSGLMADLSLLPVTELRQWAYCPRVVYYHLTMPGAGRSTYKMQEGLRAQELIENLEMRRTLREYGLSDAERRFGVLAERPGDRPIGQAGLVVAWGEDGFGCGFQAHIDELGENHRMQLAGYAVLVERVLGLSICRRPSFSGYRIIRLSRCPSRMSCSRRVSEGVTAIHKMRESQELPGPTPVRARCVECEYANYCGDVW